jgi:uncharacterized protein
MTPADERVLARSRQWVEEVVIGLNLCPFAKSVHVKGQVRYALSHAETEAELLVDLERELVTLHAADARQLDTTLLVHPNVLSDFLDYNDFLSEADRLLARLELVGELQLASFHPAYRFAGSADDDPANYTNRSPYPALHLLREASISRAVDSFPDTTKIYEQNVRLLRGLPAAELARLFSGADEHEPPAER